MKITSLPYWGQIIGLVSQHSTTNTEATSTTKAKSKSSRSLFITRPQSSQNLAQNHQKPAPVLYILDNEAEQFELTTKTLPCEMHTILVVNAGVVGNSKTDSIVMLGEDGHLYQTNWQAKKITKISQFSVLDKPLDNSITLNYPIAMEVLKDALVILYPHHIVVWSLDAGKIGDDIDKDMIVLPYLSPAPKSTNTTDNNSDSHTVKDGVVDAGINNTPATALATSGDGHWLVIGDKLGTISSYQWLLSKDASNKTDNSSDNHNDALENNDAPENTAFGVLAVSSQVSAHDGKINALRFEPVGQYFFSAGADKKLLRTHVQGELHPLDRAKSSAHNEMITALYVSDSRLFSASNDKTIKSWAFDKGQPNTCSEDLVKTRLLNLTQYNEQPALLAVGTDQSLRFIPLAKSATAIKDNTGADKLQDVSVIIRDGYHKVKDLLTDTSPNSDKAFNEGLALLKAHPNNKTIDIVSDLLDKKLDKKVDIKSINKEQGFQGVVNKLLSNHSSNSANKSEGLTVSQLLQLLDWVATTDLPKTTQVLERQLSSDNGAKIRLSAFHALAKKSSTTSRPLQYLDTAMKNKHEEIVASAIQGYLKSAFDTRKPDAQLNSERRRLLPILQNALNHILPNVRKQALASLEILLADDGAKAELIALDSTSYDVIQAGLIRLYQRDMLESLEVSRQLTQLQNHQNADVRQTAFYVSILSKPKLVDALKSCASNQGDSQLIRALDDFNHFRLLRGTLLDSASDSADNKDTYHYILNVDILTPNEHDKTNQASSVNLELSTQDFVSASEDKKPAKKATEIIKNKTAKKTDTDTSHPAYELGYELENESLEPLLQALANLHADISFRSAYMLATLKDRRAFGTLIRLIHDTNSSIRAGVAVALASLTINEAKSILPVLIDDSDASVRYVAMQAYGKLAEDALDWASTGFDSSHQDIHEQALAIFLTTESKTSGKKNSMATHPTKSNGVNDPIEKVLKQALNNPFASIRQEVVKVLLNRAINQTVQTSLVDTIALLQQSLFEDVHQVAVAEWQRVLLKDNSKTTAIKSSALTAHRTALALLLSDTFANIRKQAFNIAQKQYRQLGFSDVIVSALRSPYLDSRKHALETLKTKATHADIDVLMPVLVTLFDHESLELRGQALDTALFLSQQIASKRSSKPPADEDEKASQSSNQTQDIFINSALNSPYTDIQLRVARLLASQSQSVEEDSKAYAVFKQYLEQPIPNQDKSSDDYKSWYETIKQSLQGLVALSHPDNFDALDWYVKYLNHPDADFDSLAIHLMQIAGNTEATELTPHNTKVLLAWQKSEKPTIRQSANLALAVWGDTHGQQFFNQSTTKNKSANKTNSLTTLSKPFTPLHWLQAQQGLAMTHANQLKPLLQAGNYDGYAIAARLLLVFADLHHAMSLEVDKTVDKAKGGKTQNKMVNNTNDSKPVKMIEALPFADEQTAVFYANILSRYTPNHLTSVWQYISDYLSGKLRIILTNFNIDNSLRSNLNLSVATATSITSQPAQSKQKQTASQKQQQKQKSLRAIILSDLSPSVLQKIMVYSFDSRPLVKAKAIEVLVNLSQLLHISPSAYNSQETTQQALIQWQRSLQRLLSMPSGNFNGVNDNTFSDAVVSNTDTSERTHSNEQSDYKDLAFGTLLGVIRESHGDYYNDSADTAIRGLMFLVNDGSKNTDSGTTSATLEHADFDWQDSVIRVLLPLLNHSSYDIRNLTWESLQTLGTPALKLAEQAMSTTHEDMVERGLQLLLNRTVNSTGSNDKSDTSEAVSTEHLMSLLQSNNAMLADAVYSVLKERVGMLQASLSALDMPLLALRQRIVNEWWEIDAQPKATQTVISTSHTQTDIQAKVSATPADKLTFLKQAIKNDDWQTQFNAFNQLVDFESTWFYDETLFDKLYTFWADSDTAYRQSAVLNLIVRVLCITKTSVDKNALSGSSANSIEIDTTAFNRIMTSNKQKLWMLLDDPQRVMKKQDILAGIRKLRDIELFTPLLDKLHTLLNTHSRKRQDQQQLFDTLVVLTGYDQPIENYDDDEQAFDSHADWLNKQYPRYPRALLALFNTLVEGGDYEHATQLLRSLAWATDKTTNKTTNQLHQSGSDINKDIDTALVLAYRQLPSQYATQLVTAMAYRAEKRQGDVAGLKLALQSKDNVVQYLGAEGLAKVGSFEGLSILMATIDYHTDGDMRRRSVLALGELLGNASQSNHQSDNQANNQNSNAYTHALYKAYDKLIALAEDDEHYLQDVASEALGRLSAHGNFEHSEHIFELLKSHVENTDVREWHEAVDHWLNGLRWLDTPQAWAVIRDYIQRYLTTDNVYYPQEHAVSLLQYSDSEANKALLLDILRQPTAPDIYFDEEVADAAYNTAQKLWGNAPDMVYPYDWAVLRNYDNEEFGNEINRLSLNRVTKYSSIDELTQFIADYGTQLPEPNLLALRDAILSRDDMPKAQLAELISGQDALIRDMGIRYVMQYPHDYLDSDMYKVIQQSFARIRQDWQDMIESASQHPIKLEQADFQTRLDKTATTLQHLIWLQGRYLPLAYAYDVSDASNETSDVNKDKSSSLIAWIKKLVPSMKKATPTQLVSLVQWLITSMQVPIVAISATLETHIEQFWQQLFLSLLARPDALQDSAVLVAILQSAHEDEVLNSMSYDNRALLETLLSHSQSLTTSDTPSLATMPISTLKTTNQQIMAWTKAEDINALYNVAKDETVQTVTRIVATEALGQIRNQAVRAKLDALLNEDTSGVSDANSNEELQKLTYKVLRRWQRMMTRAEKKRPASFATADDINELTAPVNTVNKVDISNAQGEQR